MVEQHFSPLLVLVLRNPCPIITFAACPDNPPSFPLLSPIGETLNITILSLISALAANRGYKYDRKTA